MVNFINNLLGRNIESIDILLIVSIIAVIPIQILFCFKGKNSVIRALPVLFYSVINIVNVLALFFALIGVINMSALIFYLGIIFNCILFVESVFVYVFGLILAEFISRKKKE